MKNRICKKCGQEVDNRKPDPCLGRYLEGIAFACCGHGNNDYGSNWQAYCIGWKNCQPNQGSADWRKENDPTYWELRGKEAIKYMGELKNGTL